MSPERPPAVVASTNTGSSDGGVIMSTAATATITTNNNISSSASSSSSIPFDSTNTILQQQHQSPTSSAAPAPAASLTTTTTATTAALKTATSPTPTALPLQIVVVHPTAQIYHHLTHTKAAAAAASSSPSSTPAGNYATTMTSSAATTTTSTTTSPPPTLVTAAISSNIAQPSAASTTTIVIAGSSNSSSSSIISSSGATTTTSAATTPPNAQPAQTPPTLTSKLLVLRPNQLNDSFITTSDAAAVGNIVLLATEPMDFVSGTSATTSGSVVLTTASATSSSATAPKSTASAGDEELTSLSWLHDKNLLRGINLTCTPTSAAKIAQLQQQQQAATSPAVVPPSQSPSQSLPPLAAKTTATTTNTTTTTVLTVAPHTAPQSPTSDYMEESFVSEEHNISSSSSSSVSSASSVCGASTASSASPASPLAQRSSPTAAAVAAAATTLSAMHQHHQHHQHGAAVSIYPCHTASNNVIITNHHSNSNSHNNNSSTTLNKNATLSSAATTTTTTTAATLRPFGPAQIIHVSPGGTTYIEYKTANLHPKSLHSVAPATTVVNATPTALAPTTAANAVPMPVTTTSSTSSVMHFHKKYLREEHQKALIQKQSPFQTDVDGPPAQIIVQPAGSSASSSTVAHSVALTSATTITTVSAVPAAAAAAVAFTGSAFHLQHSSVDTHPSNTTVTRLDVHQQQQFQQQQYQLHHQHPQSSTPSPPPPQPQPPHQPPSLNHTHVLHHEHLSDHQPLALHQHPHLHQQLLVHTPHNHHHHLMDVIDYAPVSSADVSAATSPLKLEYISRAESMSSPDSFLSPASSPHSTPSKQLHHHLHQQQLQQQQSTPTQHQHVAVASGSPGATASATAAAAAAAVATASGKAKHPTNMSYDPLVHTANKPPLSFSSLIFLAIDDSVDKALPVKEIYAWIVSRYPYFKSAPTGWKNSVRHNLSLNKCFQKVEKAANMGKGSLWRVEEQYKPNLIQALTRSSYHPTGTAAAAAAAGAAGLAMDGKDPTVVFSTKTSPLPADSPPFKSAKPLNADLFPRLSKYMEDIVRAPNANGTAGAASAASINQIGGSNGVQIIPSHHRHLLNGGGSASASPSPPGTPRDPYEAHAAFGNATTITNNHNNNRIVINNSAAAGPAAGCFVNAGTAVFYNGSVERLVRDWGADSIDDVNAATAMLALKHGPKVFGDGYQHSTAGNSPIITSSPSEDHTYSAGLAAVTGNGNGPAAANGTALTGGVQSTNGGGPAAQQQQQQQQPPTGATIVAGMKRSIHHSNGGGTSDNTSNGTSSDAACESSEESHAPRRMRLHYAHPPLQPPPAPSALRTAAEEALEAQRHAEGVQAFLTFATEVSTMPSPLKRPLDSLSPPPHHHHQQYQHQHQQHHHHQQQHVYQSPHTLQHLQHGGIQLITGQPHNYIIESTIYATGSAAAAAAPVNSSASTLDNSTANSTESPVSSAPQSPVHFHQAPVHQYLQRHPSYQTLAAMNSAAGGMVGATAAAAAVAVATGAGQTVSPARKPRSRGLRTKLKKKTAWRAMC